MNEWKSCFFFPGLFFFPPKKSNEWMTYELFRGKEKKQKNPQKFGKKKYKQLLLKKGNFVKIWLNDRWTFPRENKKTSCIFFSAAREKKNTNFGFEWMNDQRPCPQKKKNGTFAPDYCSFDTFSLSIVPYYHYIFFHHQSTVFFILKLLKKLKCS